MKTPKIFISPLLLIFFNIFNHNFENRRIPEDILNKHLKVSIYDGNLYQVRETLNSGADPNLTHSLIDLAQTKHSLETKKAIYKLLLENNLNVESELFYLLQDNSRNYLTKIKIIENLLNIGIDPNVQIIQNYPLLDWILELSWPAKLKAELAKKILSFKPELQSGLIELTLNSLKEYSKEDLEDENISNQCPVLDILINSGVDVNEYDKYKSSVLYYTLLPEFLPKNNPLCYIKYLIDKGADIFRVRYNWSAIHLLNIRKNSEELRSEYDGEILKYLYEVDRKSCER